jgi:hypothetical protein
MQQASKGGTMQNAWVGDPADQLEDLDVDGTILTVHRLCLSY